MQFGGEVLTGGGDDGIIEERARHYIRGEHGYFMRSVSDGNSGGGSGGGKGEGGNKPKAPKMSKGEYRKIVSEINTNYSRYAGKTKCIHYSVWNNNYYTYCFMNYGFDNYEFTAKRRE